MSSSRFKARLVAVVAVASPVVGLAFLIFVGGAVDQCFGGAPRFCDTVLNRGPERTTIPIAPTTFVGGCAVAWLLAITYLTIRLVRIDQGRLLRAAVETVTAAVGAGVFGFLLGVTKGQRLRMGAEDAVLYSVGVAAVVLTLSLALAGSLVHDKPDSPSG